MFYGHDPCFALEGLNSVLHRILTQNHVTLFSGTNRANENSSEGMDIGDALPMAGFIPWTSATKDIPAGGECVCSSGVVSQTLKTFTKTHRGSRRTRCLIDGVISTLGNCLLTSKSTPIPMDNREMKVGWLCLVVLQEAGEISIAVCNPKRFAQVSKSVQSGTPKAWSPQCFLPGAWLGC